MRKIIITLALGFVISCGGIQSDIEKEIAPQLKVPNSLQIRSLSGPYEGKIFVPTFGNQGVAGRLPSGCSTFETYTVTASAQNGFGGTNVSTWYVILDEDGICGSFQESAFAGWGSSGVARMFGLLAPNCDCSGKPKKSDKPIKTNTGWSKKDEDNFLTPCITALIDKGYSESVAEEYCECALNKTKEMFSSAKEANSTTEDEKKELTKLYVDFCLEIIQ